MDNEQAAFFLLQVPPKLADAAHAFHSKLASENPNLKPRKLDEVRQFADAGDLFGVRLGRDGEWVGVCYAVYHEQELEYEIGGMALCEPVQEKGVAAVLTRTVIAQVIATEYPMSYTIVAYVNPDNGDPRPLLKKLGFENIGSVTVTTDSGVMSKDKFTLPASAVRPLSNWFNAFNGVLRDQKTRIETDLDLDVLREVLRAEADKVEML